MSFEINRFTGGENREKIRNTQYLYICCLRLVLQQTRSHDHTERAYISGHIFHHKWISRVLFTIGAHPKEPESLSDTVILHTSLREVGTCNIIYDFGNVLYRDDDYQVYLSIYSVLHSNGNTIYFDQIDLADRNALFLEKSGTPKYTFRAYFHHLS